MSTTIMIHDFATAQTYHLPHGDVAIHRTSVSLDDQTQVTIELFV